jgi:hypothetical protein
MEKTGLNIIGTLLYLEAGTGLQKNLNDSDDGSEMND